MPSISSRIKVQLKQEGSIGKKRKFSLHGEVPEKLLEVAELLAKNGAIGSLETRMRESFKEAVLSYVQEAETVLNRVKGEQDKKNENGQIAPLRAVER